MGNPRDEVISQISMWSVGGPHLGPDDAGDIYDSVIDALTAAGFRILGPDEVDPVTVDRCAAVAERMLRFADTTSEADIAISEAIRALGRKA